MTTVMCTRCHEGAWCPLHPNGPPPEGAIFPTMESTAEAVAKITAAREAAALAEKKYQELRTRLEALFLCMKFDEGGQVRGTIDLEKLTGMLWDLRSVALGEPASPPPPSPPLKRRRKRTRAEQSTIDLTAQHGGIPQPRPGPVPSAAGAPGCDPGEKGSSPTGPPPPERTTRF